MRGLSLVIACYERFKPGYSLPGIASLVYTPWYALFLHTLVCTPPTHPGYTLPSYRTQWCTVYRTPASQGPVKRPWALTSVSPWVGDLCAPLSLKSVNVGIPLRAELFRAL